MTVTLPSPARLALAVALIVAVFFAALAVGRSHRPRASRVVPTGPVQLQPSAATAPAPRVTVPAAAPPLPALKVRSPRLRVVRTVRARRVI